MSQKSLKKNAVYSFIKAFMNLAFPLISFPYASRVLMPAGIGKVNFANSIIEYFVLFAALGIGSYASREATKVRDDKIKLNKVCKEILIINLISTVFSYFLLILSFVFIPKFVEYRILLIVCSSKILFTTIGMDWLYNAHEEYKYITIRSVIFQLLSLVLLFAFVKTPNDYVFYALMGVFSSVGSNICNIFYSRKFFNFFSRTKIELTHHLKPIFIFFGTSCALKLHTALDSVMLGFMLDDAAVGYYSAANKIKNLVVGLITAIITSLMPRSSYYLEKGKITEYKAIVKKTANFTLFFSLPATVGIIMISKPLILLFSGEGFLAAIPSMVIMAPIVIAVSFDAFLNNVILTPQRKEKYSLQSQIIGCVLNIGLNFFLIPTWGVFGAAFATLVVESIITLYKLFFCVPYLKDCDIIKNLIQISISCSMMVLIIIFIRYFISANLLQLIFSIALGATVYGITMILLKNEIAIIIFKDIKKHII